MFVEAFSCAKGTFPIFSYFKWYKYAPYKWFFINPKAILEYILKGTKNSTKSQSFQSKHKDTLFYVFKLSYNSIKDII